MSTTDPTAGSTGQRSAKGGRGRGGRSGNRTTVPGGRGQQQPVRQRVPNFKGSTSEMNGHVFQCSEEQTDRLQFKTTLEALQSHVKKSFQFPEDLAPLFAITMAEPAIEMPREPGANPSRTEDMIYAEQVKQYVKRETLLSSNKAAAHAVIWGQCSEAMKTRIKTFGDYQGRAEANDCYWLLQKIRAVTMELDEKKHGTMSLLDARCELLNCQQGHNQTVLGKYKETLKGWADAIRFHGGVVAERIDSVPSR